VLVNNAGIFTQNHFWTARQMTAKKFFRFNLKGYLTSQAAAKRMIDQGEGGAIIYVGCTRSDWNAIHTGANVDDYWGIHLLNRVGEVEETTGTVIYLAHATYTTGVILAVDGGYRVGRR
jgi:NAD(P)-dependent dehydrogenase (short-subunit alcohol dehydrogenase family)